MQKQLQAPNILQRDDLKSFGGATGPCVSLYFADHDPGEKTRQDEVRLRNALEGAEQKLKTLGFDKGAISELLDPVRALAEDMGPWHMEGNAFAIFRSPDVFRVYRPMKKVDEISVVGEHFYILPILDMLHADRHFYILALSQKHVRLLRCTDHNSEEVKLPEGTPDNLEDWLNARLPNESAEHESGIQHEGPQGSFTSTTDRDRKDEFIMNFFRMIDAAVLECLKNQNAPLVLAGVEQQVSQYTRVTRYGHVVEEFVLGAPDSLKGGELHARALKAAETAWKQPLQKALEQYDKGSGDRRLSGVDRCARAAFEGRVAHLFVADTGRSMGIFNPDTLEVKLDGDGNPNAEDMLNFAALHTLLRGGEVWHLPADQIPGHAQVAAVLRF